MPTFKGIPYLSREPLPATPQGQIPGPPASPLWCEVRETPWLLAMRAQKATASLVGKQGFGRAWRFYPTP